jgi:RimJ/RimL family protein N-acetyltransferase
MVASPSDRDHVERRQQEQLLKLVTKGFYNELINYGVPKADIVTIASHLLGHMSQQEASPIKHDRFYSRVFTLASVDDRWTEARRLSVDRSVVLRPIDDALPAVIHEWLATPKVRTSFVTPYPTTLEGLRAHLTSPTCHYFCIEYEGEPVGLIGAENLDEHSRRLEMRKLVGRRDLQGMGIGTRATFAFLYYAFHILGFEKVYIYSADVNVRNLNINNQFGFTLEGVFFQELQGEQGRVDIVRMGLLRSSWQEIFAAPT